MNGRDKKNRALRPGSGSCDSYRDQLRSARAARVVVEFISVRVVDVDMSVVLPEPLAPIEVLPPLVPMLPELPVVPVDAVLPVLPVVPALPLEPMLPVLPEAPVLPVVPDAPVLPVAPALPVGVPVAPIGVSCVLRWPAPVGASPPAVGGVPCATAPPAIASAATPASRPLIVVFAYIEYLLEKSLMCDPRLVAERNGIVGSRRMWM